MKKQHIIPLVKKYLTVLIFCGVGFFAFGAGAAFHLLRDAQCERSYHLINAGIVCGSTRVIDKKDYVETENALIALIESEKAAGRLTDAAVYFRDLKNGPIFGINETADYAPASLLKLPLALVYLTQVERNPEMLNEQLSVREPQWDFSEYYHPTITIDPHTPHTVEYLLMHMLQYSDNNAYGVLQTHLYEEGQQGLATRVFLELGFIDPVDIYDETLSVRQYAGILRTLYSSSFLNAELSEKVLEWLAASDFTQGIAGGIPDGVVVAHKFGERVLPDSKGEGKTSQLHDCGIIYYSSNPYILCVMTRGSDMDSLAATIRRISSMVYDEVNSRRL